MKEINLVLLAHDGVIQQMLEKPHTGLPAPFGHHSMQPSSVSVADSINTVL
jgi:hypothetical protein